MNLLNYDPRWPHGKRGTGFFLWTVFLLLLTAACMVSWIGSFYVVGHPENPRCYRLLQRLRKLEPPDRFAVTEAPSGKFLTAKMLLDKYGRKGPRELEDENAELLRTFIKNFKETKRPVEYVIGAYEVAETWELAQENMFRSGAVALAQSASLPQVLIEHVFPAEPASAKTIRSILKPGTNITLERSRDLSALIHVARLSDSRLQFTLVPVTYASFQLKEGRGSFTLRSIAELEGWDKVTRRSVSPARGLNIEAGLPVVTGVKLQKGLADYADFRRKAFAAAEDSEKRNDKLVGTRTATVGEPPPEVATPVVIKEPAPTPAPPPVPPSPGVKPPLVAETAPPPVPTKPALITAPVPAPLPAPEKVPLPPRPLVRATPKPEPPPIAPPAAPVPPVPAVEVPPPVPPPVDAPASGDDSIFTTKEASALVGIFSPATPSFLTGEFVVTQVLGQRVSLRTTESLRDREADPSKPGTSGAIIVVDFPAGTPPPEKDSIFTRGGEKGFLIRDVRRTQSGQIAIIAEDAKR